MLDGGRQFGVEESGHIRPVSPWISFIYFFFRSWEFCLSSAEDSVLTLLGPGFNHWSGQAKEKKINQSPAELDLGLGS